MNKRSGEKIRLTSIDELLGVENEESAMEIELNRIHAFKDHPFKVVDDENMKDLVESVKENGVLTPVLVRVDEKNEYEMISGHRRMHAAKLAGLKTIPAIVREISDDAAVIAMVDANIQREELLPSEKAFAFRMKLEAMKRQGCRTDLTSCQIGTKLRTDEQLAQQSGQSARSIQRYIRLTELIPELLNLVDKKKIPFMVAVEVSYIEKKIQELIYKYICDGGRPLKLSQITTLREYLEKNSDIVEEKKVSSILDNSSLRKKTQKTLTFSQKKLEEYFPKTYSTEQMKDVIIELLETWKKQEA